MVSVRGTYRDIFRHVQYFYSDDHDVYHTKCLGKLGKQLYLSGQGYERQDVGAIKCPPSDIKKWCNTPKSNHLPDAFDPTLRSACVPVYYTHSNWGPLSFADRKTVQIQIQKCLSARSQENRKTVLYY
jgi:hypothetical protein